MGCAASGWKTTPPPARTLPGPGPQGNFALWRDESHPLLDRRVPHRAGSLLPMVSEPSTTPVRVTRQPAHRRRWLPPRSPVSAPFSAVSWNAMGITHERPAPDRRPARLPLHGGISARCAPGSKYCADACQRHGLTVVGRLFHTFRDAQGQAGWRHRHRRPGRIAPGHHTWPEVGGVTLDVYVCNFSGDNSRPGARPVCQSDRHFPPDFVEKRGGKPPRSGD